MTLFKLWMTGCLMTVSVTLWAAGGKEEVVTDYIDLDRITVNIPAPSPAKHLIVNVQIELDRPALELTDKALQAKQDSVAQTRKVIQAYIPVVKHELIFLFRSQSYARLNSAEGVTELKQKATQMVKNLAQQQGGQADDIYNVLFPNFVLQ